MIVSKKSEPVRSKPLVRLGSDLHHRICAIAENRGVKKNAVLEESVSNGLLLIDLSSRYPTFRRIFSEYTVQFIQDGDQ